MHLTNFRAVNTFERSTTLRTTWKSGQLESQIDHFLISNKNILACFKMGAACKNVSTDHKLLFIGLKHSNRQLPTNTTTTHSAQRDTKIKRIVSWNINLLKDDKSQISYQEHLNAKIAASHSEGKTSMTDGMP